MATRYGGRDRISTKSKLAGELVILGRVLAHARECAGLKQSDVAARLGLPASYLSKIESGTRRLDVIELIRIAEALGADPADLIRELMEAMS
ncbi:MAG TPA: helix-turn-helix transcriptional regulator [Thermoanaerobaculia bacterium]|nr:helix-turn-helix transcriptional regulator [Thermoanaerobaculia bacterium]